MITLSSPNFDQKGPWPFHKDPSARWGCSSILHPCIQGLWMIQLLVFLHGRVLGPSSELDYFILKRAVDSCWQDHLLWTHIQHFSILSARLILGTNGLDHAPNSFPPFVICLSWNKLLLAYAHKSETRTFLFVVASLSSSSCWVSSILVILTLLGISWFIIQLSLFASIVICIWLLIFMFLHNPAISFSFFLYFTHLSAFLVV